MQYAAQLLGLPIDLDGHTAEDDLLTIMLLACATNTSKVRT
jgi:hypothetical protein